MRALTRLTVAAAFAAVTVVPATQAEALYCGVLQPVCSTYCKVTYDALGWYCVA